MVTFLLLPEDKWNQDVTSANVEHVISTFRCFLEENRGKTGIKVDLTGRKLSSRAILSFAEVVHGHPIHTLTVTPGWLYIAGISHMASIIEVVNGPTKWVVVPKIIEFPHDEGVIDIDGSVEEEDNDDDDDSIGERADHVGGLGLEDEKHKKEETEVSEE